MAEKTESTDQTQIVEEVETEVPVEGDDASSGRGGLFRVLLLVAAAVLAPATAGAYVAYGHFPGLARTAVYFGIDFGLVTPDKEEEPEQYGEFLVLSDIIVNPAESNGKRFLLVSVGLESKSPDVLTEVETKDIVVRDVILRVLGERTVADLSSIERREGIKEELRGRLNGLLEQGEIHRLYFTQFVLQ